MAKLKTFMNESHLDTDVVLCDYCATTLHDEESDIFWQDSQNHMCPKMILAELEETRATFCLASPGSDEEIAAWLSGFDTAAAIARGTVK